MLPNPPSFFQESGGKQRLAPRLGRSQPVPVMCLHRELTESSGPRLSVRPALCPCFCHRIRVCESKSLRTGTPGLLEGKHQLHCGGAPGSRPAGVPASGKQGRCSAWPPPPRGSGLAAASCHTNPAVEPQLSCVLSAWMKLPFSG